MDFRFDDIFTSPWNDIFKVVFYPDRIYHAQYLNATRSARYRYNVREVRNAYDVAVLKGEVYLDGLFLTNFLRVEYKASRLAELARQYHRLLRDQVLATVRLVQADGTQTSATAALHYCQFVRAYQVEFWGTLEVPEGSHHDYTVLDEMGAGCSITRAREFTQALEQPKQIKQVALTFRETDVELPFDYPIRDPQVDNNFLKKHQEPRDPAPSSSNNTIEDDEYLLDFQRGWYLDASKITPVRYRNAMMDDRNRERVNDQDASHDPEKNVISMKWIVQRELGASNVFFHEVTVPPHCVEGTHQHIGTEELYYIFEGEGFAYMAVGDDPQAEQFAAAIEERDVFGLDTEKCLKLPVKPGNVIFTKSGGIHGIRNDSDKPLKFVAFLYHTS